ncbi:MAG: di-heme oxidoredictase family protein [Myxococcota bacterium]
MLAVMLAAGCSGDPEAPAPAGASSGSSGTLAEGTTGAGGSSGASGLDSSSGDTGGSSSAGSGSTGGGIEPAVLEEGELRPGGDTTVDEIGVTAFLQRAGNLLPIHSPDFESGLQFFRLIWEPAPGQAELDGLGPTYNAVSCIACHASNGRGPVPSRADPWAPGILLRLGSAGVQPDPNYGAQLQPLAIAGVPAEGSVGWVDDEPREVTLADGTMLALHRRSYFVQGPAFGPLSDSTGISARLTPHLVGMGLLEAIEADDVVALADPEDRDRDGISGRAAWLDPQTLGRFGWKASQSTVEGQSAAAFAGDLGITSAQHPAVDCPAIQVECAAAPGGGSPEISPTRMRLTGAYVRLLGVPRRRDGDDLDVRRGKSLFLQVGCADCHHPSFVTGVTGVPGTPGEALESELSSQRIWPYTDLLLHDMGEGLADPVDEGVAAGPEWRTPPLWGLGLVEVVNGTRAMLHDGRAATLAEAISWHDGEARASRLAYEALSATERALLHRFVDSL